MLLFFFIFLEFVSLLWMWMIPRDEKMCKVDRIEIVQDPVGLPRWDVDLTLTVAHTIQPWTFFYKDAEYDQPSDVEPWTFKAYRKISRDELDIVKTTFVQGSYHACRVSGLMFPPVIDRFPILDIVRDSIESVIVFFLTFLSIPMILATIFGSSLQAARNINKKTQ